MFLLLLCFSLLFFMTLLFSSFLLDLAWILWASSGPCKDRILQAQKLSSHSHCDRMSTCWGKHLHLSDQVSCNHKIQQAWNHPSKNLNGNVIKLATWRNMYLYLGVHVYILDQQRITRFEADHFIVDYWSSKINSYYSGKRTVSQAQVTEVNNWIPMASFYSRDTLSFCYFIITFSPFHYFLFYKNVRKYLKETFNSFPWLTELP